MVDKRAIRRNFARRGATYDRHAQVQREMAVRLLLECRDAIPQARRILEVGCGTGCLTRRLRRGNPEALIVALDLDPTLLFRSRQRLGPDPRVLLVAADGEDFAGGPFDLIISNAAFQWFARPRETVAAYRRLLTPGGWLAFATLGPATFRELAAAWAAAARDLGRGAPPTLAAQLFQGEADWGETLAAAGFPAVRLLREEWRKSHPTVPDFLRGLRATGATNPTPGPLSPPLFRRLTDAYRSAFGENGSIPVTYEVIWALART
jgi:malonyl-CoA O-methyltransferase